jgi:hypothetical protein
MYAIQVNNAWFIAWLSDYGVDSGVATRFAVKVQIPDDRTGCWIWTAAQTPNGYGVFGFKGRTSSAHRILYEWINGPVGSLVVDHAKCQNPPCVNPEHMEAVTQSVNIRRGRLRQHQQTHCKRDHEFTPENTRLSVNSRTGRLFRQCRECQRVRQAGYRTSSSDAK